MILVDLFTCSGGPFFPSFLPLCLVSGGGEGEASGEAVVAAWGLPRFVSPLSLISPSSSSSSISLAATVGVGVVWAGGWEAGGGVVSSFLARLRASRMRDGVGGRSGGGLLVSGRWGCGRGFGGGWGSGSLSSCSRVSSPSPIISRSISSPPCSFSPISPLFSSLAAGWGAGGEASGWAEGEGVFLRSLCATGVLLRLKGSGEKGCGGGGEVGMPLLSLSSLMTALRSVLSLGYCQSFSAFLHPLHILAGTCVGS